MLQTISLNISHGELTDLINSAVSTAIDKKLAPSETDTLYTVDQAKTYLNCSDVHIWKLRRDGLIQSVNSGRKVLIPKSSIDKYLNLKRQPQAA